MSQQLHIDDATVAAKADEAASAACKVLDEMFPGFDNGGITSNFTGHLKDVLIQMLAGRTVLNPHTQRIAMPQLVMADATFGDVKAPGDSFLVVREVDGVTCALRDTGTSFVRLIDVDEIDPFVSFSAAVQGALKWLRLAGEAQSEVQLRVVPVARARLGYHCLTGETLLVS